MMARELLNTSVVVTAEEHNPTILHPAFLTAQGIVPAEWEPAADPICAPVFSVVKYRNGITFSVEKSRLVVIEETPSGHPEASAIPELVVAYLQRLRHVPYRAVGVNFHACRPMENPDMWLIRRLLKPGPWNNHGRVLKGIGTRFLYQVDGAMLRVAFDGGTVQRDDTKVPCVVVDGNFHSEIPARGSLGLVEATIRRWPERLTNFRDYAALVLDEERET